MDRDTYFKCIRIGIAPKIHIFSNVYPKSEDDEKEEETYVVL